MKSIVELSGTTRLDASEKRYEASVPISHSWLHDHNNRRPNCSTFQLRARRPFFPAGGGFFILSFQTLLLRAVKGVRDDGFRNEIPTDAELAERMTCGRQYAGKGYVAFRPARLAGKPIGGGLSKQNAGDQ